MANQNKSLKKKPEAGEHPEAKKHVSGGVPDENSSKAVSNDGRDPRTGHDKDGNEEAPPGKTRQPAERRDSK